ncbi:MAG: ATP-grasp domain-containing protein [Planctomycetes bacterium]|nr:ATP-grasp domain-containing protein [Planctomycetota bacterium]
MPLYEEAFLLSKHQELLGPVRILGVSEYDTAMGLHDKRSFYALATRAGISVPKTMSVDEAKEIWTTHHSAFLKAPQSSSGLGVLRAIGGKQARRRVGIVRRRARVPTGVPIIAQQAISGEHLCSLSFVSDDGEIDTCVYENVLEFPRLSGAGVLRSARYDQEVLEAAKRVAVVGRVRGFLGLDFIRSKRTGELFIIDANPRPTPGIVIAEEMGCGFLGRMLGLSSSMRSGYLPLMTVLWPLCVPAWFWELARQPNHAMRVLSDLRRSWPPLSELRTDYARNRLLAWLVTAMNLCSMVGGHSSSRIRRSQHVDYRSI